MLPMCVSTLTKGFCCHCQTRRPTFAESIPHDWENPSFPSAWPSIPWENAGGALLADPTFAHATTPSSTPEFPDPSRNRTDLLALSSWNFNIPANASNLRVKVCKLRWQAVRHTPLGEPDEDLVLVPQGIDVFMTPNAHELVVEDAQTPVNIGYILRSVNDAPFPAPGLGLNYFPETLETVIHGGPNDMAGNTGPAAAISGAFTDAELVAIVNSDDFAVVLYGGRVGGVLGGLPFESTLKVDWIELTVCWDLERS